MQVFVDDAARMKRLDFKTFLDGGEIGHSRAPNNWIRIPDKLNIKRHDNPIGEGVRYCYLGYVRCLVEAGRT